jgi:hypothetical protein
MSIKLLALPVLTMIVSATVSIAPAKAEPPQEGNARWHFQPTLYRLEQPRMPHSYEPAPIPISNVHEGSVPKGSSLLGIDPVPQVATSAPRVAPLVQATMKPSPGFTQLVVPQKNQAFNQAFGKPVTPVTATLPKTATPLALPTPSKPAHALPKIASAPSASHDLHGTLLTPQKHRSLTPVVAHALPLKHIETYGGEGYAPGFLPAHEGSGMSSTTAVSGVLISKNHKGR